MKAFKFYPFHPELHIASFVDDSVNPYFGRAHKVLLPSEADVQQMRQQRAEQVLCYIVVVVVVLSYIVVLQIALEQSTPSKRARGTPKRGRDEAPSAVPEEKNEDKKTKTDEPPTN
jgi:hypothetical protein